jgi:hypothetical protein
MTLFIKVNGSYAELNESSPTLKHYLSETNFSITSHLLLGILSGFFPSGLQTNSVCICSIPHACHKSRLRHSRRLDHPNSIWQRVQILSVSTIGLELLEKG